jgi:hypothetical protein
LNPMKPFRRNAKMIDAANLMQGHRRGWVPWDRIVGAALAEHTAWVGVRDGALRVAAQHEAARSEVWTRRDTLVGQYNLIADQLGRPRADRLEVWIADAFRASPTRTQPSRTTPLSPDAVDAAREALSKARPGLPDATAAAIARLHARIAQKSVDSRG